MLFFTRVLCVLLLGLSCKSASHAQVPTGSFVGEIVATLLRDGRNLKLMQSFAYVDATGRRWDVPAGMETDGASIPRAFWITHPPFTGKYRGAAIIHDHYCRVQTRTWQETHNVFYEAMLAAGVDDRTAKIMWGAVYRFGPRWGGSEEKRSWKSWSNAKEQADFIRHLGAWVKRADPSQDEIARAIDSGAVPREQQ
jgi:hypothetical protein